jgi:acyl-CoA dehydrogenase
MTTPSFRFTPTDLPPGASALRQEVRAFIEDEKMAGRLPRSSHGWARNDRGFSERLGARGWIGMTWPKCYGGHERHALERYVVTEELLAGGAPIRWHWTADRQTGPLILEFGTEDQRRRFLPAIASGSCCIAIGLSEPDSGSDLAAIQTKAVHVDGGWLLNGRKVWTSNAQHAQFMTAFVRTSTDPADRHSGISRFLLDMSWKGVTVRPILNVLAEHDMNEVTFDDVFVPDDMVLGEPGTAWKQIGKELAYERSAPDRWLAAFDLLLHCVDGAGRTNDARARQAMGRAVAHLWTLKNMSLSIAGMLERGENPSVEASLVKDLGTQFDQEVPMLARQITGGGDGLAAATDPALAESLYYNLLYSPALTVKGGTREILRNNIARGLGLR